MNKIYVGSDHGGFEYKELVKAYLNDHNYEVIDVGCYNEDSVDYPDIAAILGPLVVEHNALGILICGTGIGISIAANKVNGVRAALAHDVFSAKMSKAHNNANILCLGQRVIGQGVLIELVKTWLDSEFDGERHLQRINKITNLEV
ncbi:MAG: ribose 5-phosphate isomerase B [Bacilli bacterium]